METVSLLLGLLAHWLPHSVLWLPLNLPPPILSGLDRLLSQNLPLGCQLLQRVRYSLHVLAMIAPPLAMQILER